MSALQPALDRQRTAICEELAHTLDEHLAAFKLDVLRAIHASIASRVEVVGVPEQTDPRPSSSFWDNYKWMSWQRPSTASQTALPAPATTGWNTSDHFIEGVAFGAALVFFWLRVVVK